MYPTSGYFKSIHCPHFNSSTGCSRPYCHFKHQKRADRHTSADYRTSAHGSVTDHALKQSAKSKSKSAHRLAAITKPHYQHDPFPTGPSTLVYKPTPISELNRRHSGHKKSQEEARDGECSDAVLNAEFHVIGQTSQASHSTEQTAGEVEPTADDCSNDSLEAGSLQIEEESDNLVHNGTCTDENSDSVLPADSALKQTETSSAEISKQEKKPVKRLVSRKVHKEFTDLFGEASDEEIDPNADACVESGDEVMEVATTVAAKSLGPVIDLTGDSDESDGEDVCGDANSIAACAINEKQSDNHVQAASSTSQTSRKRGPIVVSSSSDAGQCEELFAMFKDDGVKDIGANGNITAPTLVCQAEPSCKRKARHGVEACSLNTTVTKKSSLPTPQEVMSKRIEARKAASTNKPATTNGLSTKHSKPDYNSVPDVTSSRTYKGTTRTAHQPKSKKAKVSLERPRISPQSKSKVAVGARQMKLDMIVEECLKLYPDEADAYQRAKAEEEAAVARAGNKVIYVNLVANVIKKIRSEAGSKQSSISQCKVSHETLLAGKGASKFTVGLKRRNTSNLTKEDMHGDLLFKKLRSYVLSESQLVEQGYPRPSPGAAGQAVIKWSHYDKVPQNKGNVRTCKRCGKGFALRSEGGYVSKEECVYHWGKSWQTRVHGTLDMHFSCCQGKPGAEGCTICNGHVHDTNKFEDLTGYMKTFAKNSKDYCGVFSLDCEMIYTTKGLEIARVTVIDDKLNIMLDSFIKPEGEVIDYNTRFSGLTADNFKNVDSTLKDIQAILLNMFQEDTVLIGHSLNSDLIALKLIHDNVVDTSMVWPHKHGLPHKRALKTLMLEILNKLIQEAGSAGHDSSEDASACMELMKWKVFQDYMKDNR